MAVPLYFIGILGQSADILTKSLTHGRQTVSSVRALERPANLQKPPEICQEIGTFRHDGLSLERVARHDHSARSALCFFLQCEASERSERAAVGLPHRFRAKYMMLPHPIIITGNCQGNLDETLVQK